MEVKEMPAAAAVGGNSSWLVLVAQLPEEAGTRMRILRTLESLGCAILGEATYILPESAAGRQGLARLAEHVGNNGGACHLLGLVSPGGVHSHQDHAAALAAGGTDNGPPGLRPHYGARYFAAFVVDPEGHRLEAVYKGAE
jgi:hypothetical protein